MQDKKNTLSDYKDGVTWKNYIFSNWAFFRDNIADPLEVVECLVGETTPQIITDYLKEQIKVYRTYDMPNFYKRK